jgi:hypothetical protein
MKCHGSGQPIGPVAAGSHVRCLWCGRDIKSVTPPPGEPETLPAHNLPALTLEDLRGVGADVPCDAATNKLSSADLADALDDRCPGLGVSVCDSCRIWTRKA